MQAIGACNTVRCNNGEWHGYNTDFIGVIEAIKHLTGKKESDLKGKKAVLLGAGGAAKAIAYALNKLEMEVTILNRTQSKAKTIAELYGFEADRITEFDELDYELLINATSVGNAIDVTKLKPKTPVLDINYMHRSELLEMAKEKGCPAMNGLTMLLYQGVAQFQIWFEKELPIELVAEQLGVDL